MERRSPEFAYGMAGVVPIVVGAALVALRGTLDSANLALILVLMVVLTAALAGRGPAAVAAISAAASFDFFCTKPYGSLRIADSGDLTTALILLGIGLVVGQVAVVSRANRAAASLGREELAVLRRFAERAAAGAAAAELTVLATDELIELLCLVGCRYEREATGPPLPILGRSGRVEVAVRTIVDGEFALPALGVRLPVVGGGGRIGSIVMDPDPRVGVSVEQRLVAVALADQLGAALAAHAPIS